MIVLVLVLAAAAGVVDCGHNCAFDADSDTLRCGVDSLGAQNVTLQSVSKARGLVVGCTDAFAESILRTNHFGYLNQLRSLQVDACKVRRVPALAFSGLSALTSLTLNTGNAEVSSMVMEVEPDAFTGLNSVRSLNLSRNNIWTLPQSVFCGLDSLVALNLSSNYLQDAQELSFSSSELHSCKLPVRTLDASNNRFTRLTPKVFGQLRKLEQLVLTSNSLNVIDDHAFSDLSALSSVNLANNALVALPSKLFSTCCQFLQELRLDNNSLSGLAPGLFAGLEHLLVLNVSRNEIGNPYLTADTFSSQVRLVALDLSFNQLTRLDASLLKPLTALQLLDLSGNQITALSAGTFSAQHNLHILRLSRNRISTLNPQAFSGLSVLSTLALDHNALESLHKDAMRNCSGLVDLELQHNAFSAVPSEALAHLTALKSLDLGENKIGNLSGDALKGLSSIVALRLASNGIVSVQPSVFGNVPNIRVLNLAGNLIEKLDQGVFNAIKNLRMLRLDGNRLEDINGILAGQTELRWLNVSANRLQWFDYAFIPKSLEWLSLTDNLIEELGNYYKLDTGFGLKTLDASRNRIKKLDSLSLPNSLQIVVLRENAVRVVAPAAFQDKANLIKVDLAANQLRRLSLAAVSISTDQARGRTNCTYVNY
jgi:Leucine-rich repeat (LRR) protein